MPDLVPGLQAAGIGTGPVPTSDPRKGNQDPGPMGGSHRVDTRFLKPRDPPETLAHMAGLPSHIKKNKNKQLPNCLAHWAFIPAQHMAWWFEGYPF